MNAEYINPVLIASRKIINIVLNEDINLGQLSLESKHNLNNCLAVMIWMNGDFSGRFVFEFERGLVLKIATKMIGEKVEDINDMAKSALSELSTMILGRTGIIYSERSIDVRVSYPTLIEGDSIYISALNKQSNKKTIVNVPIILSESGTINLKIEKTD